MTFVKLSPRLYLLTNRYNDIQVSTPSEETPFSPLRIHTMMVDSEGVKTFFYYKHSPHG